MPLNHSSQYAQLTEKQFELIGRAVVEWSNLEYLLGELLARLLHMPLFPARTYTDQLSANRIEQAIHQALTLQAERYGNKLVSVEVQSRIRDLLRRIQETRTFRNTIAHFCWARHSDDIVFGTSLSGATPDSPKARKGYTRKTNSDFEHFCRQSYDLVEETIAILKSVPAVEEEDVLRLIAKNKETNTNV